MKEIMNEWKKFLKEDKGETRIAVMCRKNGIDGMCDYQEKNGKRVLINFFPSSSSVAPKTVNTRSIEDLTGNFCANPDNEGKQLPNNPGLICRGNTAVEYDMYSNTVNQRCPADKKTYDRYNKIVDPILKIEKNYKEITKSQKCSLDEDYNNPLCEELRQKKNAEIEKILNSFKAAGIYKEEEKSNLTYFYQLKPECDEIAKNLK